MFVHLDVNDPLANLSLKRSNLMPLRDRCLWLFIFLRPFHLPGMAGL